MTSLTSDLEQTIGGTRANLFICKLAGYLLASVSKTDAEWREWCEPFLLHAYKAQFGDRNGEQYFHSISSSFSPIVGKGVFLWMEEVTDSEIDAEFMMVHTTEQHLHDEFATFSDEEINNEVQVFSQRFMQFILDRQSYDARMRTLARKMSQMLHGTAEKFRAMELEYFQKHPETSNFGTKFQQIAQEIPKQSLLVPYRMWRVGFVAVGGGALVGAAGVLAAPTIVASLMPLLTVASTFLQVSLTMDMYLTFFGVANSAVAAVASASSPVIPSFLAAYGAVVSGRTMLKRTDELGQFDLLPLHISTKNDGQSGNRFALRNDANAGINGGPVYILVPGHMDKNVDLRALWGANGSVLMLPEDEDNTLVSSGTATSTTSAAANEATTTDVAVDDGVTADGTAISSTEIAVSPAGPAVADRNDVAATEHTQVPIAQSVLEHEVHLLKQRLVQRIHDEVEHDLLPLLPTVFHLQDKVKEELDHISDVVTHMPRDIQAESDWEDLKLRYQGWWRDLVSLGEEYVLQWETMLLTELNDTFYDLLYNELRSHIVGQIKDVILSYAASALMPLKKALSLPKMVLSKIEELDGAWVRAMERARQAGHLLARTLYTMKNGGSGSGGGSTTTTTATNTPSSTTAHRPVTLIGYGMGARLIFHCLEHLYDISRQHHRGTTANNAMEIGEDVKGIVENAILLGAPVSTSKLGWWKARMVVSDRLVNGYARFDWMLALMYRVKSYELGVAGLYPVHLHEPSPRPSIGLASTSDTVATTTTTSAVAVDSLKAVPMITRVSVAAGGSSSKENEEEEEDSTASSISLTDDEDAAVDGAEDGSTEDGTRDDTFPTAASSTKAAATEGLHFSAANFHELQDVENVDLTHIISVHADYPKLLYTILNMLKV